jgi:DNA-binding Lrp family transcriptional regulator
LNELSAVEYRAAMKKEKMQKAVKALKTKRRRQSETMKDVELRLISELMKHGRKSDRELAKAIGASQPTVTRTRSRLEKEGIIREYTIIPDFNKIGYKIMAITFALSRSLDKEEAQRTQKVLADSVKDKQFEFIMLERGNGLGFDGVVISLHENYASYLKVLEWLRQFDFLEIKRTNSFLINLEDEVRYRPLTFSAFAQLVRSRAERKKNP